MEVVNAFGLFEAVLQNKNLTFWHFGATHPASNGKERGAPYIHMLQHWLARGELHFNELLILVCAPVIIIDFMNIYAPCLKFRDTRRKKRREGENTGGIQNMQ